MNIVDLSKISNGWFICFKSGHDIYCHAITGESEVQVIYTK